MEIDKKKRKPTLKKSKTSLRLGYCIYKQVFKARILKQYETKRYVQTSTMQCKTQR